jgi:Mrp family chromosome partitioning ATPase
MEGTTTAWVAVVVVVELVKSFVVVIVVAHVVDGCVVLVERVTDVIEDEWRNVVVVVVGSGSVGGSAVVDAIEAAVAKMLNLVPKHSRYWKKISYSDE